MRALKALLILAWRALLWQPLHKLFTPRERSGKALFLANYQGGPLTPYSVSDRALLTRFSGCINCGLCDAVCPINARPSLFALAYSRATPELPALERTLAVLDGCGSCTRCADICPRRVPLLEIFAFTRRKLAEISPP